MELQPYPAYKDSGVPWLGQVPEHWTVGQVKRYYEIQLGKMLQNTPASNQDLEVNYLKAQHVQWFKIRATSLPRMWASPKEVIDYSVQDGDLLGNHPRN